MAINCSSGLIVSSVADSAGNVYSLAAGPLASPGQGNVDSLPHGNRLDLREQRRKFEPRISHLLKFHPGKPRLERSDVRHRSAAIRLDPRGSSTILPDGTGSLTVTAPANSNLAPPGNYMLFIISTSGVPSISAAVDF